MFAKSFSEKLFTISKADKPELLIRISKGPSLLKEKPLFAWSICIELTPKSNRTPSTDSKPNDSTIFPILLNLSLLKKNFDGNCFTCLSDTRKGFYLVFRRYTSESLCDPSFDGTLNVEDCSVSKLVCVFSVCLSMPQPRCDSLKAQFFQIRITFLIWFYYRFYCL